jgi:predicted benzoate:H+ symporter BenE
MDKSTYTGTMSGTLLTIFYNLPKEKLVQTAALACVGAVVSFLVTLGLKWIVKFYKRGS